MAVSGIFSALVIGLIIGALGRLVVPGKQRIPLWLTIQIALAAGGVSLAARMYGRRHV